MNETKDITSPDLPANDVVGSAVGLPRTRWYVAIVHHNTEKQSAERLTRLGIENYLPLQQEIRVWRNGRKAKVERTVIPSVIFIHCTEAQRREVVKLPFIYRFMTNKAGGSADTVGKPIATVSDTEINKLRFMLGQSDIPVTITDRKYRPGDKVRVIRGSLAGLEGEVTGTENGKSEVTVALEFIGCATLKIDPVNLEYLS